MPIGHDGANSLFPSFFIQKCAVNGGVRDGDAKRSPYYITQSDGYQILY